MLDHWVQRAEQGFDQEADVALFPGVDFEDRRIAEAMVGEFALIVLDGRHVAQVGTGDAEHDASLFDKAAECLDEERQVVDRIGAHVVEQQDESDAAFGDADLSEVDFSNIDFGDLKLGDDFNPDDFLDDNGGQMDLGDTL